VIASFSVIKPFLPFHVRKSLLSFLSTVQAKRTNCVQNVKVGTETVNGYVYVRLQNGYHDYATKSVDTKWRPPLIKHAVSLVLRTGVSQTRAASASYAELGYYSNWKKHPG